MVNVAVVEDNPDVLDDVLFNLGQAGFVVRGYADGRQLQADLCAFAPQVVVLDIGLPGEDGLSIAQRLRNAQPLLGIVILTARAALQDRVAGHLNGADNYLCKPVAMEELIAVIHARARIGQLRQALWRFCPAQLALILPDGQRLELTAGEAALLQTLLDGPNQQASRAELILAMGADPERCDMRRLEVAISRLRSKIRQKYPRGNPLRALRNQGYAFHEPVQILHEA